MVSKSISKRITVTKTGKVLRRHMGVDHFKTHRTKKAKRQLRKTMSLNYPLAKFI